MSDKPAAGHITQPGVLIRAYLLQTHEMLFDAHWHGFRVFGGVPGRGIYDNMKTAVDRVGRGKERQVNIRFLAMTNHYVFAPEFCNPAAGWEKGQVEKNGQDARPRLWQQMPDFPDLAQRKSKSRRSSRLTLTRFSKDR
ncbi:transposase [Rhizobium leguminosarum]